jgi:4-amino-4-deoxychorismate lyase
MTLRVLTILGRGVVDPSLPVVAADDAGLTRGDGCFEGLRLFRDDTGAPVLSDLEAHLDRLGRSAGALGIAFDRPRWTELAETLRHAWNERCPDDPEAAVKFVLTRGRSTTTTEVPTGFATASDLPDGTLAARSDGIDVVALPRGYHSAAFGDAPWLLGGVKTLSYAINMAAQREAARRGAHDVIFISSDGLLLEAPTSSVVWVADDTLHTVAAGDNGILASITQRVLFDQADAAGIKTSVGSGTVDDLRAADAVLLVGSVRGPVGVRALDGVALPVSSRRAELVSTCQELTGFR